MSLTYSFEQVIYNQTIIKQVIKFNSISIMIKSNTYIMLSGIVSRFSSQSIM